MKNVEMLAVRERLDGPNGGNSRVNKCRAERIEPMSVDLKVYQLAEAIAADTLAKQELDSLADAIQDAIENWFESEGLSMP